MKKILFYSLIVIVVAITALLSYVKLALPNVGEAENLKIEYTPERIKQGEYLANHVAVCMDCHSTRDWSLYSGPLVPGTLGKGGEAFTQEFGFPGKYYAKNISTDNETGIGSWTDGELFRAITAGVSKDGHPLFPVMPYPSYGKMDKEDIYSIIAYLRSLPAIKNEIPKAESDFPMNFIIHTIPQKPVFSVKPDEKNTLEYGKYLFTMAGCGDCHTKQEKGAPIVGMELAGGFEFPMPNGGIVRSANITPDLETGIGTWTETSFLHRFKMYQDSSYVPSKVENGEFQTVMPWMMYSGMKDEDLKAIYAYLKTIKPINNRVEKFTAKK